ncbi:MAG: transposase [Actinobacteria bacterium]|nr:transposase [Actinomycetota bacterium]
MGIKRRKYPGEFKIEMVEEVLSGHSTLEFARLNDLNPNLIIRWKRQ